MKARSWLHVAVILALTNSGHAALAAERPATGQDQHDFEAALRDDSTSPSYVLVKISDGTKSREVCIPAPFLLGAIHMEFHIPYSTAGVARATRRALEAPGREFTFRSRRASVNVTPRYSEELLQQVKARLDPVPDQQLPAVVRETCHWGARRDACAHVLVQRGFRCRIADLSGSLVVDWSRLIRH